MQSCEASSTAEVHESRRCCPVNVTNKNIRISGSGSVIAGSFGHRSNWASRRTFETTYQLSFISSDGYHMVHEPSYEKRCLLWYIIDNKSATLRAFVPA